MSKSVSRVLGAGLVVVALVILPLLLSQNDLRNFARFLALVLAVLGVNIALGAGGIVSLGQSVFVGVGAFALVVFADDVGLPILVALPLAALFTGLVGVVLGFPSLRVSRLAIRVGLIRVCHCISTIRALVQIDYRRAKWPLAGA